MNTLQTTDIIQLLQQELEQEAATTRKMLERVPDDKYSWQPHEKSMTIKQLATHVAELPSWISLGLTTDELNFATVPYQPADINNTRDLLTYFEKSLEEGQEGLKNATEEQLTQPWVLRDGDQVFTSTTKYGIIRISMSQIIHHRAQLGVYLRLLNIPIPGSYGPSADEQ
ncbi:DinB family protein [Pontibacter rugosus]|uniref:DinB family protein n=1 Tax=Pontibacter rugosus TaxID=1745966 RepID=A0ABW3STS0_9BACT